MINSKKGNPVDIVFLLVIVFFLAVSMVVALFMNTKIQSIISTTELNSSGAYESINDSFNYINSFVVQRGFTLFFGILCIGILVSSFLVRVHPVFIFIYIFTLVMAIFTSVYLANAYEMVVSNPQLSVFAVKYTMITWVMQHIAKILLAVGALSFIILFGKIGGGGNSNVDL
ncbi:MAG: hypothetical protein WC758_08265 [Candidatus Woesearchaeota archaeon]|jgi:hypothetical protein